MDQVAHDIENRLESQARIPRSAASLFAASKTVARQELHGHVEALRLPENHPGIQGIGLVGRIPPGQKPRISRRSARKAFPVQPPIPAGGREFHAAILYIEPFLSWPIHDRWRWRILNRITLVGRRWTPAARFVIANPGSDPSVVMNSIRFFTIHILKPLNRFRVSIGRAIEEFCRRLDQDHQSLEEAAALHRAIFESRKIVRILVNPDNGRIVDANQAAADFYGYPRTHCDRDPSGISTLEPRRTR